MFARKSLYVQLEVTRDSKWGEAKDIVIMTLAALIGLGWSSINQAPSLAYT
jgi:hypothetical protein